MAPYTHFFEYFNQDSSKHSFSNLRLRRNRRNEPLILAIVSVKVISMCEIERGVDDEVVTYLET